MDPIFAGASALALVGATTKVIKGIRLLKALQDAPRELDDLFAETSQFDLVLHAVQNTDENPGPELRILLEAARDILVDFDSLIEYRLTEAGSSHRVDRGQWTRKSKDVERLRGKLKNVTANLVALIGVNPSRSEYRDPPLWAATARWSDFIITELLLDHGSNLNPALSPASAAGWLLWAFADLENNYVEFD